MTTPPRNDVVAAAELLGVSLHTLAEMFTSAAMAAFEQAKNDTRAGMTEAVPRSAERATGFAAIAHVCFELHAEKLAGARPFEVAS